MSDGSRQIARAQAALIEVTGQLAIVDRMVVGITEKASRWRIATPEERQSVTIPREQSRYNERITIFEEIRRIFDRLGVIDERLEELKKEQAP